MLNIFLLVLMIPGGALAIGSAEDAPRVAELNEIYNLARTTCMGISGRIGGLKNTTTANTVVSGVGTVASGGALYSGIKKAQIDKQIEKLQEQICAAGGCDAASVEAMSDADFFNVLTIYSEIAYLQKLQEKSVSLGNWRTGLMATGTATNIASAIMAGLNKNQSDLIQQITACNIAVEMLLAYDIHDINPIEYPIVKKIDSVKTWCHKVDVDDIEKIEKKQKVVMGTSIAGAATGTVGTVTSAVANSAKVRNDNSAHGKNKEKNLNTTANVMAGTTTVLSGVSTGFNIAALSNINKVIKSTKLCEEAF